MSTVYWPCDRTRLHGARSVGACVSYAATPHPFASSRTGAEATFGSGISQLAGRTAFGVAADCCSWRPPEVARHDSTEGRNHHEKRGALGSLSLHFSMDAKRSIERPEGC